MSEERVDSELLSRDELDAIVGALAEASASEGAAGARGPFDGEDAAAHGPLLRALQEFGEEQSRALSTLHQRPIEFRLLGAQTVTLREFADGLLDVDRVAVLDVGPRGGRGYLMLGRSLLFGWLTLAFGARADTRLLPVPARPYTRIEERFLRRACTEVAQQLASILRTRAPVELDVVDLVERDLLPQSGSERVLAAAFEVSGLEDLCRLRVALPPGLLDRQVAAPAARPAPRVFTGNEPMLNAPVQIHAELGHADLTLRRVSQLAVGDVIRLTPAHAGGLVVRIESEPKFQGVSGSVGSQLAVQITEPIA